MSSYPTNASNQINEAGNDGFINNARVRCSTTNPLGVNYMDGYGTPTSMAPTTNTTVTASQLGTGICVINPSTALTVTLDSAANLVSYMASNSAGVYVGDYMTTLLVNGGTATLTLAAGANGSFDTNQASGSRILATGVSKYVFLRMTNVTPSSETYTIYS